MQRILRGRLTFTPREDGQGYDFVGETRFDRLFSGIAVAPPTWFAAGDVRGLESIGPDDTFDGDYGRLLDRVYVKGVASPIYASWNLIRTLLTGLDTLRRAA